MEILTNDLIYNHKVLNYMRSRPHFSMKHVHNTCELIFFEHGDAHYIVESRRYHLRNNDLIITLPGSYHYIEIKGNVEYSRYNVAFNPALLGNILNLVPKNLDVLNCPNGGVIAENFRRMDYYSQCLNETDFQEVLLCLLKEIFYNIPLESADNADVPSALHPIIIRSLEYINQNLFTIKDVPSLCQDLNISESYFFKLFSDQVKVSPMKYINLKRLQNAQKLIQDGHKPSKIYLDCGFGSYVGFYKQYIKVFNRSPSKESIKPKSHR